MNKNHRRIMKCLTMITQIGISILVPIFLAIWIGNWLDASFHTSFWFLVFLFLGIGAAMRNVYLLLKPFYEKDLEKENEELRYFQELKDYSKKRGE